MSANYGMQPAQPYGMQPNNGYDASNGYAAAQPQYGAPPPQQQQYGTQPNQGYGAPQQQQPNLIQRQQPLQRQAATMNLMKILIKTFTVKEPKNGFSHLNGIMLTTWKQKLLVVVAIAHSMIVKMSCRFKVKLFFFVWPKPLAGNCSNVRINLNELVVWIPKKLHSVISLVKMKM